MPDENEPSSNQELNSWKEIASHLERGVRTVQRWESELGLPVRRTGRGKRGAVYALVSELELWRVTSGAVVGKELDPGSERAAGSAVEESRRLMSNIQSMVLSVSMTTVRQRQQAQALQKRLDEMRRRLRKTG
ncbi:MAG: hypothetical protein ACM34E_13415 [Acidobacteriota bacterium]